MSLNSSGSVLVKIDHDPLYGYTRESYLSNLKNQLEGRVERLYIFGSFVTNTMHKWSDIDIIIVCKTTRPFLERAEDFNDIYDIIPNIDLLVYTPQEFTSIESAPTAGFWKDVIHSMQRIM